MNLSTSPGSVLVLGLVTAAAALSAIRRDVRPFAAAWASFLPIEIVTLVDNSILDVVRYGGALGLLLCVRPEPRVPADRTIAWLSGGVIALGLIRVVSGLAHNDNTSVRNGAVLAVGAAAGALLVRRRSLLPALTTGYLAGLALTATVSVMQAMHVPTLARGSIETSRYPGLAAYTTGLSWQISAGLIIAVYLVATGRRTKPPSYWFGVALVPLFCLALLTNGAQGGLLGLGAALFAVLVAQRGRISLATAANYALAAGAAVAVGAVIVLALGVEVPTATDYLNSDFVNERARVETYRQGISEFRAHPLVGMSSEAYVYEYRELPHFLPIESAALTGVAGLAVAVLLVLGVGRLVLRGPSGVHPLALVAYGLVVSMYLRFFTDPQGPILGLARMLPLLAAVLLAGSTPADLSQEDSRALPPPEPDGPDLQAQFAGSEAGEPLQ